MPDRPIQISTEQVLAEQRAIIGELFTENRLLGKLLAQAHARLEAQTGGAPEQQEAPPTE